MLTKILEILSDGEFHSGEAIAQRLQTSRASICKYIKKLNQMGLEVNSLQGRGYRANKVFALLNKQKVLCALPKRYKEKLSAVEFYTIIDSTNHYLKTMVQSEITDNLTESAQIYLKSGKPGYACFADYQTKGKGRRGRTWYTSFANSICFSVVWRFNSSPMALNGLSLIVGVELAKALVDLGINDIGLKWPNDLYWRGKKLGGILIEVIGEDAGPCYVIAGVGLNLVSNKQLTQSIDQPWTDINQALSANGHTDTELLIQNRNHIASILLQATCKALDEYQPDKFRAYRQAWQRYDCCYGQSIEIVSPDKKITGIMQGIDEFGRLLLETNEGIKTFSSGEVSLRIRT